MNKYILCCDWGTTSFRLRLVDRYTYEVAGELLSSGGVAGTFRSWKEQTKINRFDYYSEILKSSILELGNRSGKSLESIPVIVSGMASSTLGMEEIPYAELPFNISGIQASVKIFENFNGPGANLVLVSGLKSYEDVMRGEEAQLIGLD
jgi:2-dehydro-3-deoxygalactonokinase